MMLLDVYSHFMTFQTKTAIRVTQQYGNISTVNDLISALCELLFPKNDIYSWKTMLRQITWLLMKPADYWYKKYAFFRFTR